MNLFSRALGLDLTDQKVLAELDEVRAEADLAGLRLSLNVYVSPARKPARQTLCLLFRRPGGGKALVAFWPSWRRAKVLGHGLRVCEDWQHALHLAVEALELAEGAAGGGRRGSRVLGS